MAYPRRKLIKLAPLLTAGVAGCSSNEDTDERSSNSDNSRSRNTPTERPDADNDGVPDSRDDYPNDADRSEQLKSISDTRRVEEDHWRYYSFEFDRDGIIEYEYIVRDGPSIDVIFMDESEYDYFEDDENYRRYEDVSTFDDTGDRIKETVSPGEYKLVFDNTNREEAKPPTNFSNDVATIEFSIETSQ